MLRVWGEPSPRARAGIAFLDQGVSSASNFLLLVLVAGVSSSTDFARFALTYTAVVFVLSLVRSGLGVPLNLDRPGGSARQQRLAQAHATAAALVVGIAVLLLALPILLITGGLHQTSVLIVAIFVPVVVLQDTWRVATIAALRPLPALASDVLWLLVLLCALAARVVGVEINGAQVAIAWATGAIVATLALAAAESSRAPRLDGLWSAMRERRRGELAADAAIVSLNPLAVSSGVAALVSLNATAALRGAGVLLSPINVLMAGAQTALLAEAVGKPPAAMIRRCALVGAAIAAVVATLGVTLWVLPDRWGTIVLGRTWQYAAGILPCTILEYLALSAWTTALVGLRALHRTGSALGLRVGYALTTLLLAFGAASTAKSALAVAFALAASAWMSAVIAWITLILRARHSGVGSEITREAT